MGNRLTKIVTRTGDDGKTNLGTQNRLFKDHPRIVLLGALDELNSAIGLTLAHKPQDESICNQLRSIQNTLFDLGSELCPPFHPKVTEQTILELEKIIILWNDELPPLKEFILPGGDLASAQCHMARAICRRAERCAVTLQQTENIPTEMLRYLNRLSDLLFVAARVLARISDKQETMWQK